MLDKEMSIVSSVVEDPFNNDKIVPSGLAYTPKYTNVNGRLAAERRAARV